MAGQQTDKILVGTSWIAEYLLSDLGFVSASTGYCNIETPTPIALLKYPRKNSRVNRFFAFRELRYDQPVSMLTSMARHSKMTFYKCWSGSKLE
eukprot:scaffold2574_cov98-Cylindrotheca_fusiformis.AAC.16